MHHRWEPYATSRNVLWIRLAGSSNATVRCIPCSDGRFMWQFRAIVSYAATIIEAMNFVEAGAEFFDVMRRNPYGGK